MTNGANGDDAVPDGDLRVSGSLFGVMWTRRKIGSCCERDGALGFLLVGVQCWPRV